MRPPRSSNVSTSARSCGALPVSPEHSWGRATGRCSIGNPPCPCSWTACEGAALLSLPGIFVAYIFLLLNQTRYFDLRVHNRPQSARVLPCDRSRRPGNNQTMLPETTLCGQVVPGGGRPTDVGARAR